MNANKYYTYTVLNSRCEIVAQDQYEGRDVAAGEAQYYAKALNATAWKVRSPSGRIVASGSASESVTVTQS